MNNIIFALKINAILEDDTEVTDVTGIIIDNKRVYKLSDGTVLSGTKKIKTIKSAENLGAVEYLINIMSLDKS
tara:strand:+ start:2296 stop:2514 length:219 start_codon:yes stop_codon:yes gene_type:complete